MDRDEFRDRFRHRGRTHAVRPRWAWLALAGLLLGAVIGGVGVAAGSWPIAAVGLAIMAFAGLAGLRGGLFYDVVGRHRPSQIVHDVRTNAVLEGPDPADRQATEAVTRRVRASEERRRDALARAAGGRRPGPAPLGAGMMLVAGGYLLLSQWTVYADSATGDSGGLRALGLGVLVMLCAARLLSAGRSPVATLIATLAGLGCLAGALLASHDPHLAAWGEAAAGAAIVGGAALTLVRHRGDR